MLSAASRTTLCLTGAQGSSAYNVIPPEAAISANLRLLWGDSLAWVLRRLKKIIRDPGIELQVVSSTPPSQDSTMTAGFSALKSAIEATWPQAVVTPYLMVASTDSRYWREICDNVYRFSGKYVTGAEKATVHGTNERIRIENTENAVRFFLRLLREC
jgi:carboxypeptidase PM20D1